MLWCLLLAHYLCQGTLLDQTHVRIENLQGNWAISHQLVQKLDFVQGVVPLRFLFTQILQWYVNQFLHLISNVPTSYIMYACSLIGLLQSVYVHNENTIASGYKVI